VEHAINKLRLLDSNCWSCTRFLAGRMESSLYVNGRDVGSDRTRVLRKEVGRWLASLRLQAGLSQRELADAIGSDFYTFISQIENGKGRIPPNKYGSWADAVRMDRRAFVKTLLSYYDPITHDILFGEVEPPDIQPH
jgi:DNA-binding XRE family transcriptional regulator